MEKITLLLFLTTILLNGCTSKKDNSAYEVTSMPLILIDESKSTGEKTINLSELLEDYNVVRFENSDSAFFKYWKPAISENYIAFLQGASLPVVLFDRNGKFLCNIGKIGQGPGEYTMVYDALIDEGEGSIYIAPFASGKILEYDLSGNFKREHAMGNLNKPILFKNPDGSISVVTMAFNEMDNPVTAVTFGKGNDIMKSTTYSPLVSNLTDPSGNAVGYDNEIWRSRNTNADVFMMTFNDTLYTYNPVDNIIVPRAYLNEKSEKDKDSWYVGMEIPRALIYNIIGPKSRSIWYDKNTGDVSQINIINDFLGNSNVSTANFHDGYFVQVWDPGQLISRIEERWLSENDMTDKQRKELLELFNSLNDNDNNIMFIGALKK